MTASNILVVEDQNIIALDLKARLLKLGYHVTGLAASGQEALQQVRCSPPDLVLMDVVLKGELDGIETAARIRADYHLPIVYVTAHSDEYTLARANATEPFGYILKPFEDSDIRSTVELALHKYRLERQAAEREARFRSLLELANDIIVVLDDQGQVSYFSPASERLFGHSPLTGLRDLLLEYVDPADVARLADLWQVVVAQPGAQRMLEDCRVRGHDGTWRTLTGTLTNRLDDPAVRGIVVNAYDLTEQKQTEATLARHFADEQRHARELAALNLAFRTMSSSLEPRQVLAAVADEIKRLIGTESVSVLLRDDDDLQFAAASGPGSEELVGVRLPVTAGLAGAVFHSQTPSIVREAEADARFYPGIDRQTGLHTRSLLAVPLVSDRVSIGVMEAVNKTDGEFTAHDLDLMQAVASSAVIAIEHARLYETLRDHHRRLQAAQPRLIQTEKMAALGRLTASLAHEINNPLQAVQGSLGLIGEALDESAMDSETRAAIHAHVTIALSEVQRLAQLAHRLRDFYQANRSTAANVDVSAIITQVLDLVAQSLAEHQIVVARSGVSVPVWLPVNPDHLRQLVLNLVLNAIDVMPHGGVLRLELSRVERRAAAGVCLAISDTGPAIPAALLPATFEPFQAVRANDSSLGLSICYELASSLGGEITVSSEPAAGTKFAVWLPYLLGEYAQ